MCFRGQIGNPRPNTALLRSNHLQPRKKQCGYQLVHSETSKREYKKMKTLLKEDYNSLICVLPFTSSMSLERRLLRHYLNKINLLQYFGVRHE